MLDDGWRNYVLIGMGSADWTVGKWLYLLVRYYGLWTVMSVFQLLMKRNMADTLFSIHFAGKSHSSLKLDDPPIFQPRQHSGRLFAISQ